MQAAKTILTTWKPRTYDVWGNAKDGWDVNDVYGHAEIEIEIPVTVNNAGTSAEFISAYPTDKQIREALDLKPRVRLSKDGDDVTIYVRHIASDFPCGELQCTSHESLSPIREKSEVAK